MRDLFRQVDPARVAALAISNQRETVGFLDEAGEELRPAILWLDERCRPDIDLFGAKLPPERFRAITGKTPDPTPAVFSLHWLMRCEPEHWRRMAHAVDVLGYLGWRLTGHRVTSWGSADPHGLLDLASMRYSPEILAVLGMGAEQLFPAVRPGTVIGEVTGKAAEAIGLRPGTLVVAGGGDGQASGLGTGTLGGGRAYLNLGTAAVSGVWGRPFATSHAFRTLTSLSGEGYIFELCLRTGRLPHRLERQATCSAPILPPTPRSTSASRPRPRRCRPEPTGSCCYPIGRAPWRRSGTRMPEVPWSACAQATAEATIGARCSRAWHWIAPWATAPSRPRPASR